MVAKAAKVVSSCQHGLQVRANVGIAAGSRGLDPFGCVHGQDMVKCFSRKHVTNGDRANLNAIDDNRDALPGCMVVA